MNSAALVTITIFSVIVGIVLILVAVAVKGRDERWAILGAAISFAGTVVSIVGIVIQHSDAIHFGNLAPTQSASSSLYSTRPSSAGSHSLPYSSSTISLASNSPLRKRIPSMDDICGDLGQSNSAWLPGQASPTNYTGRVIFAPGAAFTWSCTEGGPKLTPAEITRGCQIWYPGSEARTWDPNNAYSWVCI